MDVLVSVIIPIYNSEQYLEKCLTSIVEQTYTNLEIIVVDSGAKDNSRKIADRYKVSDERVVCIDADGPGAANARMSGAAIATGKYITFVDSDDYIEEDCISCFVEKAEKNNSELVICGYKSEMIDGKTLRIMIPDNYIQFQNEMWAYRICSSWGRFYLRDLWERFSVRFIYENGAIGEDMPVSFLTNVMAKNISVISEVKYHYVQHDGSIMGNMRKGVKYKFPYEGICSVHNKLKKLHFENSRDFYYFGLLRFFAKYYLEMAKNLSVREKREFKRYVTAITKGEINNYLVAWDNLYRKVDLPIIAKMGMLVMLVEIRLWNIGK